MAFERDRKLEDYSKTKLQSKNIHVGKPRIAFSTKEVLEGDHLLRLLSPLPQTHRDELDLQGIATDVTKNRETQKIRAIIKAHCQERTFDPSIME